METVTLDGITYNIDDLSSQGFSGSEVKKVLENLHSTDAYKQEVKKLVDKANETDNTRLTKIDITIDRVDPQTEEKYGTAVGRDPNDPQDPLQININSDEFRDATLESADKILPGENGEKIQHILDFTLAHEVGHLLDERVNGTVLDQNEAKDERVAIEMENKVREELGMHKRHPDGHGEIRPFKTLMDQLETELKGGDIIDPDQTGGLNKLPDDYYTNGAPENIPTTKLDGWLDKIGNGRRELYNKTTRGVMDQPDPDSAAQTIKDNLDGLDSNNPVPIPQRKPDFNAGDQPPTQENPDFGDRLSDFFKTIIDIFKNAFGLSSPLVLDMDGDGVELTSLTSFGAVYWDGDVDGMAEASGWVHPDDALLAIDLNNDGIINNSSELFGNATGAENGFTALAELDTNSDGAITSADAAWGDLRVWQDANNDGYSQSGELATLDAHNITQIALEYAQVDKTLAGNKILQEGTFTMNGITQTVADAYFTVDQANSTYNAEYELDIRALFLPTTRGYGNTPDLHIAMSLDNEGEGNLLDLVSELAGQDLDTLFADPAALEASVKAVMYRWAGVDGLSGDERGPLVDARDLGFLEKFTGEGFLQRGVYKNPYGPEAAGEIDTAFAIAYDNILARLLIQSAGRELFEGNLYYNLAKDSVEGVNGLDTDALDSLSTQASALESTQARESMP